MNMNKINLSGCCLKIVIETKLMFFSFHCCFYIVTDSALEPYLECERVAGQSVQVQFSVQEERSVVGVDAEQVPLVAGDELVPDGGVDGAVLVVRVDGLAELQGLVEPLALNTSTEKVLLY